MNDLIYAPAPFAQGSRLFAYVDFKSAHYTVTINVAERAARARSVINFEQTVFGCPLFDLVGEPSSVRIDGSQTSLLEVPGLTRHAHAGMRAVDKDLAQGPHVLEIVHELKSGLNYTSTGGRFCFDFDDMDDRLFLEQYLPTSFEYDSYEMTLDVVLEGTSAEHVLYSNGVTRKNSNTNFTVTFPSYFGCSCPYLDLVEMSQVRERRFDWKRGDGSPLPVIVYADKERESDLEALAEMIKNSLAGLDSSYGAFPHPALIVRLNPATKMEYAGAATVDLSQENVNHELNHNYFARCVLPADGNAGWIDEAIAGWEEFGRPSSPTPPQGSANLSNRSPYERATSMGSQQFGSAFLSYLDALTSSRGGLGPFLHTYFERKKFQRVSASDFRRLFENYLGRAVLDEHWALVMADMP